MRIEESNNRQTGQSTRRASRSKWQELLSCTAGYKGRRTACFETNNFDSNSLLDCGFVKLVFVAVFGFFLGFKLGENHHFGFIKQDPLLPNQKTDSAQFRRKSLWRSNYTKFHSMTCESTDRVTNSYSAAR